MRRGTAIINSFLFIFILIVATSPANAEETDFPFDKAVYIISGRTFVDPAEDILVKDTFYVWHSFDKVHITYSRGNETYMDGDYRQSVIQMQNIEGGRLIISVNGTEYYNTVIHANTVENSLRYELGIMYDGLILSVFSAFVLSLLFAWNKWSKIDRDLIGSDENGK